MAAALKDVFSPALVRSLADQVAGAHAGFPRDAFVRDASRGLAALELMDRGRSIATALGRHLPPDDVEALAILVRALGAPIDGDDALGAGLSVFRYLPFTIVVSTRGLACPAEALAALHAITQRFTGEWAIRPFLETHPELTLATLARWTSDPSAHVRRLVSEGTRLRLPWAGRLGRLEADPSPALALLEPLRDDPSPYVRRSVGNHLNDLARVDPDRARAICRRWLAEAPEARRDVIERALRGLVKKADAEALALLGYGTVARVELRDFRASPRRVAIGGRVVLEVTLASRAARAQDLHVDLVVGFVKKSGVARGKIFKLGRVTLPPRGTITLAKTVSLAVHTTRKPNVGRHPVAVLVNGARTELGAFTVTG